MLFRQKKYQLFFLSTLLLAAFFVVEIKKVEAAFDPAVTYSKTSNGQLSADEWNNLQNDFVRAWGSTTAVGGIGIGIAPQGTDINGLVASSTIKTNTSFLGALNASYITPGAFNSVAGTGGNFSFPVGLGIGTTPVNAGLHLSGSDTYSAMFRLVNSGASGGQYFMGVTNSAWTAGGDKLVFGVGIPSSANVKMVMGANGNVGIGTTAPTAKFHLGLNSTYLNGTVAQINWESPVTGSASTNLTGLRIDFSKFTPNTTGSNTYGLHLTSPTNSNGAAYGLFLDGTGWDYAIFSYDNVYFSAASYFGDTSTYVDTYGNWVIPAYDGTNNYLRIGSTANNKIYATGTPENLLLDSTGNIIFNPTNNVGIGTTAPGYKLDVTGDANFNDNYIHGVRGPVLGTDAANRNYVDTLMASTSAGIITQIATSSLWQGSLTGAIYNNNSGNVGIGTNNPGARLETFGQDVSFYSGTGTQNLNVGRNATEKVNIFVQDQYGYFNYVQDESDTSSHNFEFNIQSASTGSADWIFKSRGLETIRFKSGGNVGIGTTGPSEKLGVAGNIILLDSSATIGGGSQIKFYESGRGNLAAIKAYYKTADWTKSEPYVSSGELQFLTQASDSDLVERMRITSGGNVGIGTTTPGSLLTVGNNLGLTALGTIYGATSTRYLDLSGVLPNALSAPGDIYSTAGVLKADGAGNSYVMGKLGVRTSNPGGNLSVDVGSSSNMGVNGLLVEESGAKVAAIGDGGASGAQYGYLGLYSTGDVERVRLYAYGNNWIAPSNGNVGIGTTNPTAKLDVSGNTNIAGLLSVSRDTYPVAEFIRSYNGGGTAWVAKLQVAGTAVAGKGAGFVFRAPTSVGPDRTVALFGGGVSDITTEAGHLRFAPAYGGVDPAGRSDMMLTATGVNSGQSILSVAGLVGIGTTAPGYKLDVAGEANFNGNQIHGVAAPVQGTDAANKSYVDSSITPPATTTAGIQAGFWTTGAGGSIYNNNSSGLVGIGTTNPESLLHLSGANANIRVQNSGFNTGRSSITFGHGGSTNEKAGIVALSNGTWGKSDLYFVLDSENDSGPFDLVTDTKIVIKNSGSVGIGTTAPNQQLEITKNFRLPATVGTDAYGVIYKNGNRFIHDFNYGNNGIVTTVGQNTFVGINAGNFTMGSSASATSHSSYNTGIGVQALQRNTTGSNNSAIGVSALYNNTTGTANSVIGVSALSSNTTGSQNSAIGVYALQSNTTGSNNSAIGISALQRNTTGSNNSAIGVYAGRYLSDGTTGRETGNDGLYLGYNSKASDNGTNNEIVIGYNAIGKGSNTAAYGNSSMLKHIFEAGNVGIGTTAPTQKLHVAGDASFMVGTSSPSQIHYVAAPTQGTDVANRNYVDTNFAPIAIVGSASLWATSSAGTYNVGLGNVGIGTTAPAGKLHVSGDFTLSGASKYIQEYVSPWMSINAFGASTDTAYLNFGSLSDFGHLHLEVEITGWANSTLAYGSLVKHYDIRPRNISGSWSLEGVQSRIVQDSGYVSSTVQLGEIEANGGAFRLPIKKVTGAEKYVVRFRATSWSAGVINNLSPSITQPSSVSAGTREYTKISNRLGVGLAQGVQPVANFHVEGNSYFNGNVGIGTTSPNSKLHISGSGQILNLQGGGVGVANTAFMNFEDSNGTDLAFIGDGSASSQDLSIWGYANTILRFGSNNAERMRIAANGNVGIGTTTPGYKLDLAGDLNSNTYQIHGLGAPTTGTDAVNRNYVDTLISDSVSATDFWKLNGSNLYASSTAWNVGIGTIAPSEKLTITGGNIKLYSQQNVADSYRYIGTEYDNGNGNNKAEIRFAIDGSDTKTRLTFHTANGAGTLNEQMRITSAGNVGIGTTNPGNFKLNIVPAVNSNGAYITNSGGNVNSLLVENNNADYKGVLINHTSLRGGGACGGDGCYGFKFDDKRFNNLGGAAYGPSFVITRSGTTTISNLFQVDSHGINGLTVSDTSKVGVGTTTPVYKLDLAGDLNLNTYQIHGLGAPATGTDAVNRNYVDTLISDSVSATDFWKLNGSNLYASSTDWNVGIGTATPNQQLEITKNFRLPATVGTDAYGVIYKDGNRFIHDFNYGDNGIVTTAGQNTFLGVNAGNFTMGSSASATYHSSYNTGIGVNALSSNTTGYQNSAIGLQALVNNTTGSSNSAIGMQALYSNTTGSSNSAIGLSALRNNTTGSYNSAIGVNALYSNTTGSNNSAIGVYAGRYLSDGTTGRGTGNNGLYLGYNSRASANGTNNEIVIGFDAIGKGSNTAAYGNSSMLKHIFEAGNVGIGTTAPTHKLHVAGDASFMVGTSSPSQIHYVAAPTQGTDAVNRNYVDSNFIASTSLATITNAFVQGGNSFGVKAILGTNDNQALGLETNGTEKMTILANGNVGVGTNNPVSQLQLEKTVSALTDVGLASNYSLFLRYPLSSSGAGSGIAFGTSASTDNVGSAIIHERTGGEDKGKLNFYTKITTTLGAAPALVMTLSDNGNVGIGTTTPGSLLTVGNNLGLTALGTIYNSDSTRWLDMTGAKLDSIKVPGNILTTGGMLVSDLYNAAQIRLNSAGSNFGKIQSDAANTWSLAYSTASSSVLGTPALSWNSAGNVGIGTTDPRYKLQVDGVLGVKEASGSNATRAIIFADDNGAYYTMDGSSAKPIIFKTWTNGSETMRINTSGNVGIGTTAPAQKLHVAGDASFMVGTSSPSQIHYVAAPTQGTDAVNRNYVDSNFIASTSLATITNAFVQGGNSFGAKAILGTNDNQALGLETNGTEKMTILANGNVGIGTTAPSNKLEIGNLGADGSDGIKLSRNTGYAWGSILVERNTANTISSGGDSLVFSSRAAKINMQDQWVADGTYSNIRFYTADKGAASVLTERMAILYNGNVGIGTTTPGSLLTVGNNLGLTALGTIYNSDSTRWLDMTGAKLDSIKVPGNILTTGGMLVSDLYNAAQIRLNSAGSNFGKIQSDAANTWSLAYSTASSSALGTPALSWNSAGNVGIGTASPRTKLELYGIAAAPSTASINGGLILSANPVTAVQLAMGVAPSGTYSWIQSRNDTVASALYNLAINPLGGNVGIGTTTPSTKLYVNGVVTATGGFSGPLTGTVNAANISKGVFGTNTGQGTYSFGGVTANGDSHYQWEGATYRNPGDYTPQINIRQDNATTGINGFKPALTLYNQNGDLNSTIGLDFSVRETTAAGNATALAGIMAIKESAGTSGAWTQGGLLFYTKNMGTRVDALRILNNGNVGIGTTDPGAFKLKVAGNVAITGTLQTMTGSDFAEEFTVSSPLEAGTVVVMGDLGYKSVKACNEKFDSTVVGVVSDNPSIIAGRVDSKHKVVVAMAGVVKVKVSATNGKIKKGSMLTTSNISGYAMKADSAHPGTIIGKALENLSGQQGEIKVLINLQ